MSPFRYRVESMSASDWQHNSILQRRALLIGDTTAYSNGAAGPFPVRFPVRRVLQVGRRGRVIWSSRGGQHHSHRKRGSILAMDQSDSGNAGGSILMASAPTTDRELSRAVTIDSDAFGPGVEWWEQKAAVDIESRMLVSREARNMRCGDTLSGVRRQLTRHIEHCKSSSFMLQFGTKQGSLVLRTSSATDAGG
eukprot:1180177-Prorocentrum_minimum.AAC.3